MSSFLRRMNEQHRQQKLLALLDTHKALSTHELVEMLAVSPATARRDISKLHALGKLKKVRNGVEALGIAQAPLLAGNKAPAHINRYEEKRRIAEAAAKLCRDVSSVVLTCGSTMMLLGEALCGRDVQIITNYLPLANKLIAGNHHDVVILGGQYNKNKGVTLSLDSHESLYAADILFTSGKGFSGEGLFKNDMLIAHSEQKLLHKAQRLVALVDSSKLGKEVGMLFAPLAAVNLLITGEEADPAIIAQLRAKGLDILLA